MPARFVEARTVNLTYNCPPIGYFAVAQDGTRPVQWDHCREQFLGKMSAGMGGFFFCHHEGRGFDLASFVSKFEDVCGMNSLQKPQSNFSKTDKPNIIWIEPSLFWMDCLLKKSLLTLVCRCALNYDSSKDNFDHCLFGELPESKYVRETKNAVLRFLFGYTRFRGELPHGAMSSGSTLIRHGWHAEFAHADLRTVKSKLVMPDGGDITNGFGFDFIWN